MHTPLIHLYHNITQNGDKLDVLDQKMDWNTRINLRQSKALHHQDHLLGKVLHNQSHDAMRDWKQMKALKNATHQRMDIWNDVKANGVAIAENGVKADQLLGGQQDLKAAHAITQEQLGYINSNVLVNESKIDSVAHKVAEHRADFADHRADFAAHVDAAAFHDAKQDGLIAAHAAHDVKQDGLIAAQAEHDAKQDGLIASHAETQSILSKHAADHADHAARQNDFNTYQTEFNAKVDSHMMAEKSHMHQQDHEMAAAAHHRAHEDMNMFHGHHSHHGHHNYVSKTVMKPVKKAVLVLPHGSKAYKKEYESIVPVTKTYSTGHHHHGHHGHHY